MTEEEDEDVDQLADDENSRMDAAGPSTSGAGGTRRKTGRGQKKKSGDDSIAIWSKGEEDDEEADESFVRLEVSPWISSTFPKRAPYFPQLNDQIVYFKEGHERYLLVVHERDFFDPGPKPLPSQIDKFAFCIVRQVKFMIDGLCRVCMLRLQPIDSHTGRPNALAPFYVK